MKHNIFFTKRSIPFPTIMTVIITICIMGSLLVLFCFTIHPFLATNNPIKGEAIIAEGWIPDYCFELIADQLKHNQYKYVFVTGIPLEKGSYLKEYKNYAEIGRLTLEHLSIPDSIIYMIPAPCSPINRTYASAIALKRWLDSTGCSIHSFDVFSLSTHTRRSALLFRKALGKKYEIGSIALEHRNYEPKFWWKYSEGVRSVIDETVAYLYALFFISFSGR